MAQNGDLDGVVHSQEHCSTQVAALTRSAASPAELAMIAKQLGPWRVPGPALAKRSTN